MAFAAFGAGASGQAEDGPELSEVYTKKLAFKPLKKDAKLKLFRKGWNLDAPPPPTASLLSISQRAGLLAAGGPEGVIVARTSNIRKAFTETSGEYTPFEPDFFPNVGAPQRISQVEFSSDGAHLVISAESGGGLAVYNVQKLLQGDVNSEAELPTGGEALRVLLANPATEYAELFAVVTAKGELSVVDLKTQAWRNGPKGNVYETNVSCVSWSIKGKALIVGHADGSVSQLMADGKPMTKIPRPPNLPENHHVSGIEWLALDLVVIAYSSNMVDPDAFSPDPSPFYIMQRSGPKDGPKSHRFSLIPDVCWPTGSRLPNVVLMKALSKYHTMDNLVLVASSAAEDLRTITKATVPLAEGAAADTFSLTSPSEDGWRAALPFAQNGETQSYPIGLAVDLTSTEKVERPVPGSEDICEISPGPLPAMTVLNNEGVLSAWWIVFADAVLAGVDYPGMVAPATQSTTQTMNGASTVSASAFDQKSAAFGQTSTPVGFAKPAFGTASTPVAGSAFGQSSTIGSNKPAFGSTSTPGSAFGQASSLGAKQPAFGSSGFVTPQTGGFNQAAIGTKQAAFGSNSGFAQSTSQQSPFGAASGNSSKPAFGTPSSFGTASASPWGQSASATPKASAFGTSTAFGANASPTNHAGASTTKFGSPSTFGQNATQAASGSPSPFGAFSKSADGTPKPANPFAKAGDSSFGSVASSNDGKGLFGLGGTSFDTTSSGQAKSAFVISSQQPKPNPFAINSGLKLESSFADQTSKSSESDAPVKDSGNSLFGDGFGDALSKASKEAPAKQPETHEEAMEDDDAAPRVPESPEIAQSTTPQETPAVQKTLGAPPISGGMFGSKTQTASTPAAAPSALGVPSSKFPELPKSMSKAETIKSNEPEKTPQAANAPLPPVSQSKDAFTPTNSSTTSSVDSSAGVAESAPLPPDPVKFQPKQSTGDSMPPLPPDFTKVTKPAKASESTPVDPVKLLPDAKPAPANPFAFTQVKKNESKPMRPPGPPGDQSPIDDEGSGVDVANEVSPEDSPESSFLSKSSGASFFQGKGSGSFKPPAKNVRSVFDTVTRPHIDFFKQPEPSEVPDSPRSPSPVRQPKAPAFSRPPPPSANTSRSASGPAGSRSATGQRKVTTGRPQPPTQTVVQPIASAVQSGVEKERRAAEAKAKAQSEAEEQELSDDEDEYIRAELEEPVKPTTTLPGFVAHQDYTGKVNKEGIPGQVEIIYRDANSMVDTLGLNVRAIRGWVEGHSQTGLQGDPHTTDLETPDRWTLVDIDNTGELYEELYDELAEGQLDDIGGKVKLCRDLTAELNKLKMRNEEITKTLGTVQQRDSDDYGDDLGVLSAAQSDAQQDLRRAFSAFRSNLSAAEEGVALLRAKLASTNRSKGTSGAKVPTVEAVERTIKKMTDMVEKKSEVLDSLAAHLQSLGFVERPSSSRALTQGQYSRAGSPLSSSMYSRAGSSAQNGSPMRASMSGKAAFTPRGSRLGASYLAESMSSLRVGSRNDSIKLTDEDLEQYTERLKNRKKINEVLKTALGQGPMRVRPLLDDD